MIVIAGGSGRLGREVTRLLTAEGRPVRILTRDPARTRSHLATALSSDAIGLVDVVGADVRDPASLIQPIADADVVVSAIQGFGGHEPGGLKAIDIAGNQALIRAAVKGQIRHFILVSMQGSGPAAALALARAKGSAEAALRSTDLHRTIIRPSAYIETWAEIIGEPIISSGRARLFGAGVNPINFISSRDVAAVVAEAALGAPPDDRVVELRGPEDLTFEEMVGRFASALGRPVSISHVPRPALRVLSTLLRPARPILADQIAAARIMDIADLAGGAALRIRPSITVDEVIRARIAGQA